MSGSSVPTLRQHLVLLVVISAIPAFALVVYGVLQQYAHSRATVGEHTQILARHIASEQASLTLQTRTRLKLFAASPEIARRDFGGCSRRFAEQLKLMPVYSNIGFATPDGTVVCSGRPLRNALNIANAANFQQTLKSGDLSFAQVPVSRLAGQPLFAMRAPAFDDRGRTIGVVFASVPLAWYAEIAEQAGIPAGYRMTVLDREFNVLARNPPDQWIGKNISAHPLAKALHAADEQGTLETDGMNSASHFFAFVPLRKADGSDEIFVVLGAPTAYLYANARMILARDVLALLIVIGTVILGAWFGAERLVLRHLNEVIAAARRFSSGHRTVRIAETGRSREIVDLQRMFNETAATLHNQIAHIERLNRLSNLSSATNKAIARIRDRKALLDEVCRIAVEIGRFKAAWVGVPDSAGRAVVPAAFAGLGKDVIEKLQVSLDPENPRGKGMSSRALRDNVPVVLNDRLNDPAVAPWRELLSAHALRSGAAFPIPVGQKAEAVMSLYAAEPGFFEEEDVRLLQELAADAGLALEIMKKEEQLHELSYFDRLTGLPNRRLCEDRLAQAIKRTQHHGRNAGLLLIRLNRFRQINDLAGWAAADTVLKSVARYLQHSLREGDTVARHGDNEYAVVLADVGNPEDVMAVTDKILEGFPRVVPTAASEVIVSVSIGIAIHPADAADVLDLMQKAQSALDSLPGNGKTTFAFYSKATDERAHARHRLEGELFHALERGELSLHYQPIVMVASRQPVAAEALLRWTSPGSGAVSPSAFVPIAEDTGLIVPIGYWVLEQACLQLRAWHDRGLPPVELCVNVSVVQLREHDFLERVADILSRTAVDPRALPLGMEITESELMHNIDHAVSMLQGLRRMGIRLSIDDFGTGYSSLSYLRELPIQALKIDVSFIRKLAANSDAAAITRGIIALAHGLGLEVVAEGVETEEQLAVLHQLGCDNAQGYLFRPGMPATEFMQFLQRHSTALPFITASAASLSHRS